MNCPHCHTVLGPADARDDSAICPSCGSTVHVEHDRTRTYAESHQRVGHFELLERVGSGACGAVWKARDLELDRLVAVKIPHPGRLDTEQETQRFLREGRSAGQLRHPGIVSVHEVGRDSHHPYLVCDFVRGVTLAEYLTAHRIPARDAAELVARVAEALDYAHSMGVVHRDIKPSNIMLELPDDRARVAAAAVEERRAGAAAASVPVGRPLLMDFGLALRPEAEVTMTMDGQVLGTPAYMSPEQAAGLSHGVDARSDVYSLGVVLYELLTGRLPFRGHSRMLLEQVLREEPPGPRTIRADVPRDLETVTLRAMAKEPERRYPTARALAEDLQRFLRGEPVQARPIGGVERLWRWCRRHPQLAGAIGLAATLLVLVAVGGAIAAIAFRNVAAGEREARRLAQGAEQSTRAALAREESAHAAAERAGEQERLERRRAEQLAEENRRNLYVARINLAAQASRQPDVPRGLELLDELRPRAGAEDLRGFEWYQLWQRIHAERSTLFPRSGVVRSVAFSPDGRSLATSCLRGARLWDVASGRLRGDSFPLTDNARSIAFSPDGTLLAIGGGGVGRKGHVTLWDIEANQPRRGLDDFDDPVLAVAFAPDGKTLVTGTAPLDPEGPNPATRLFWISKGPKRGEVKLWDVSEGKAIRTLEGLSGGILSVAFSRDGGTVAAGSWDHTVRLWDARTSKLRDSYEHSGYVWCVAFSPDGNRVASGSGKWDGEAELVVHKTAGGTEADVKGTHQAGITAVAFAPDGKTLATGSWDRAIKIWDAATVSPRHTLAGHTSYVSSLAFSPDGALVASGSWDETAKLWYAREQLDETRITGNPVVGGYSVSFSPDGRLLATSSSETVTVLDRDAGRLVAVLPGHSGQTMVTFSPNGKTIATGGFPGQSAGARIYDTEEWTLLHELPERSAVWSLAYSPDGSMLATGCADRSAKLWDVASGEKLAAFDGQEGLVRFVTFSPDGKQLAASVHIGAKASVVKIWDLASHEQVVRVPGHSGNIEAVLFTPDGKTLITCSHDHTAKLWDTGSWKERATLKGHVEGIYHEAIAPDGRTLATAGWDGTVRLWSILTGQLLLTLPGEGGVVWHVAFAPDGRSLAAGSGYAEGGAAYRSENQLRIWHASDERSVSEQLRFMHAPTPRASSDAAGALAAEVHCVALSPRGDRCACAGSDGTVTLYDVPAMTRLAQIAAHTAEAWCVAFSPDGRLLASAGWDGVVKLWDAASGEPRATLAGDAGRVYSMAFAPDGQALAIGNQAGVVALWDTARRTRRATFRAHESTVSALAYSPDGAILLTGSWDRTVGLWDAATAARRGSASGLRWAVTALVMTPDGKTIIGAGGLGDPSIYLWDAATGAERAVLVGHSDEITALALPPGGNQVVSTSWDGCIITWDLARHTELNRLDTGGTILAAALDRSGQWLATGGKGITSLWDLAQAPAAATPVLEPRPLLFHSPPNLLAMHAEHRWAELLEAVEGVRGVLFAHRYLPHLIVDAQLQLGRYAEAAETCERHADTVPACSWAIEKLAQVAAASGQYDAARAALDRLAENHPRDALLLNNMAWMYVMGPEPLRDAARAVQLAERAAERAPGNYANLNTLGVAEYRAGNLEQAIASLDAAARANPNGATAYDWFFLAMSYQRRGEPERARDFYERACTLLPGNEAKEDQPDAELRAVRSEAEAVLGIRPEPAPRGPSAPAPDDTR